MQYVFSDSERQELAISTVYSVLAEFPHRTNRYLPSVISTAAFLRLLILFTVMLASVNLLAIAYIVLRYVS